MSIFSNVSAPRLPRAPLMPNALVSCLTVTQPGRETGLYAALNDFARQSYLNRELIVLHDGDANWDARCTAIADDIRARTSCIIHIHAVSPGKRLGELRNESVARAHGTLLCQWDDDDRFHPDRLRAQVDALYASNAAACYLTQQLHRFADTDEIVVENWSGDYHPRNVVQGSALVRRDAMPEYPALSRSEDTALLHALVASGERIARVESMPWLYCYQYHGGNTFARKHHDAIAQAKRLSPAAMLNIGARLQTEMSRFEPRLTSAR